MQASRHLMLSRYLWCTGGGGAVHQQYQGGQRWHRKSGWWQLQAGTAVQIDGKWTCGWGLTPCMTVPVPGSWRPTHDDVFVTCFMLCSCWMNVRMDHSCLKGLLTLLKVASRYHSFTLVSISDVKKRRCRQSWTRMSSFRKSARYSVFLYLKVKCCRVRRASALMPLVSLVDQCLTGELGKGLSRGVT